MGKGLWYNKRLKIKDRCELTVVKSLVCKQSKQLQSILAIIMAHSIGHVGSTVDEGFVLNYKQ